MAAPGKSQPATAELNRRIRQIFDEALEQPESERPVFLERACEGNPELLATVSRLVGLHGPSQSFLEGRAHHAKQIGRYVVIGELGRGGMGVVYDAIDPLIGRSVAVKVIHLGALGDQSEFSIMREGLFREARAAGKLFHPGIVTILDMGQEGDAAFVTMERVEGPSLQKILAENHRIERAVALNILSQAAVALDYAHRSGVAHRDVKPGNILLDRGAIVKITDFGIAKITSSLLKTLNGLMMGTPGYMSPEQVEALPADGRSDQFSLAVVAYELLTGGRPFQGDSLSTVAHAIVYGKRPSAHAANSDLAPAADKVLERALARRPSERYANCAEFVAALDRALTGSFKTPSRANPIRPETLTAQTPSFPPRPRKISLRYLSGLAAVALLAAAIAVFFHLSPAFNGAPAVRASGDSPATPAALPMVAHFAANPESVTAGESTHLEWEAANATRVSIKPDIGDVSGQSQADAKPGRSTLYSLTATGPGGSVTATTFVNVTSTFSPRERLYKEAEEKQNAGMWEEALALFRQSARMGEPRAMEALGEIFLDGTGAAKNDATASTWFRKAADLGNLTAMLYLGYMYQFRIGMPQSYGSAMYWFGQAADAGNPAAIFDLGMMYERGQGVPVNLDKALELYQKASSLGNEEAKKRLAQLQYDRKKP